MASLNSSVPDDDILTIKDLVCNVRDAVVQITGKFLNYTNRYIQGSGFFIKGHYIICPSLLVFNPEDLSKYNTMYVTVSNVTDNNPFSSGKSYIYHANIIGIDGIANIAILKINPESDWNKLNPAIREYHPFLIWGKSRSSAPGQKVLLIGDFNNTENAVLLTNIADNRYVDYNGNIIGELLLLANNIPEFVVGLPVIDFYGKVIAMQVNKNMALTEFFMRRPIKGLIRSFINNEIPTEYTGFIEKINDCYNFVKGYIGLSGKLVTSEYILTINQFTNKVNEIVGYYIDNILENDNQEIFSPGDILLTINGCALGDRKNQVSPALIMWRVLPGTEVKIKYLQVNNNYKIKEIIILAKKFNILLDHPSINTSINPSINTSINSSEQLVPLV